MPEGMVGYEEDLFLWSQQQAAALREAARRGANLPIDWENVAEEIEGLGRSDRRAVVNRLATIVEHLLKLEHSPAPDPRRGWAHTIRRGRRDLEKLLRDSPSLRGQLPALLGEAAEEAREDAAEALDRAGEAAAARRVAERAVPYSVEQVVGAWLPEPPGPG